MKTLMLAAVFAGAVVAQSCPAGMAPVQDTIYAPATGSVAKSMSGTVSITPKSSAGVFGRISSALTVSKGQFFACLAPGTYAATYLHTDAQGSSSWREEWVVPVTVSTMPLSIDSIRKVIPISLAAAPAAGSYCLGIFNGMPLGYVSCALYPLITAAQFASINSADWSSILP